MRQHINPLVDSERQTQNRIIKLLHEHNGYNYIGNLKQTENRNILDDDLREFLKTVQGCSEAQATEAINALKQEANACTNNAELYTANKNVYFMLRQPKSVSQGLGKTHKQIYYIDWNNPANNFFYVAEEVTVRKVTEDIEHRRPDIVLYVNGIALAVIELKKSTVSVEEGIRQNYRNQQDGEICDFFTTPQLLLAGNESQGVYYGTTNTAEKYWLRWKEPAGEAYDYDTNKPLDYTPKFCQQDFPNELDRSILQMTDPERLLEFLHDCVVFDGGVKKVARPNQYFGLKSAKVRVKNHQDGIIWHSQGSGKSLTMVWLAQWIKENAGNDPRVLIITDRDELDKQIKNGFIDAGEQPVKAKSGSHLLSMLNGTNMGRGEETQPSLMCTLIHKFGIAGQEENGMSAEDRKLKGKRSPEQYMHDLAEKLPKGFKTKGNMYVFVDECHRTQGGILNKAMKRIMGDGVMLIGFTGTPLLKGDKGRLTSKDNFGPYIHTYKFDEAVDDGVVRDLRYEARHVEQELEDNISFDTLFEAKTKGLTSKAKEELQERWATMQHLYSSKERVKYICNSIIYDMDLIPALRDGWANAMLVAEDIYQAFRYWKTFQDTSLKGKCAVVTSYDGKEPSLSDGFTGEKLTEEEFKYKTAKEMLGDKTPEEFEDWAKDQFTKYPGKMKLLIVVDKLLTGFDAPTATYLYIDKVMHDHDLFQAICRVNRNYSEVEIVDGEEVNHTKDFGYIVDFKQLFNVIEESIEDYTNGAFENYEPGDVKGLLKDKLTKGKEELDAALERCDKLSEPVALPRSVNEYFDYFCFDQRNTPTDEQEAEIIKNTDKREDFYNACYTLVRRYTAISMQMEEAGYTTEEADKIFHKVKTYDDLRSAIAKRCGDFVDIKAYDAEMRALLDNYVDAHHAKVLEKLDDFSFLDIIKINKDTGEAEVDPNAEEELGGEHGVAETMTSNTRRAINKKRDSNPEQYRKFSEKINRLLEDYRQGTIEYKELLKRIKELTEEMKQQTAADPRINTPALRALYDNLGDNVELALMVHDVIIRNAAHNFRTMPMRKKKLLNAITNSLLGTSFDPNEILKIAIAQKEYDA